MSTEAHVSELLPDYALGCLDDEESAFVAKHLADCSTCQAELEQYQTVTDQLVWALSELEPPAALKDRLEARIRPGQISPGRPQISWRQKITGSLQRAAPVWSVVSLVLILVLGITTLILWQRLNQLEQITQSQASYAINLVGTENAPNASGFIIADQANQENLLIVTGLPQLDQTHQYQLWLVNNGQRTSGAVFSVSVEGYSRTPISAPIPISNYTGFGISIEPFGGSEGPTGNKVLGSTF